MIKKLLIVGGTGFIGRKLAQYSLRFNFNTYILSKNKVKGKDKLSDIKYIKCDCTNVKQLTQKISKIKFDYVINSSGYINHNPYSSKIGKKTFEEHFEVVKNLVSILNRGNLKKFLQIGSSDEYGNSPSPQSENYRENPISPYSFGKVASTHFLQMLNRTEQFKSTTVKDCSLTNKSKILSSSVKLNSNTASNWDFSPSVEIFLILAKSFPEIISWSIKILIKFISDSLLILIIIKF